MPAHTAESHRLLGFNRDVLEQMLALVALHEAPGAPAYAGPMGAHLRHLIEHFEALVFPAEPGVVDYDSRPRDAELERSPALAHTRVLALSQALARWPARRLGVPVRVHGLGGLAGEFRFAVASSIGRELAFVASHAVHHFAVLKAHCQQHGIAVPAEFGKAPATVAHERAGRRAPVFPSTEDPPCPAPTLAA